MNMVRGYIFSRPFMGERVPQHVQNLVIRDYCEKNGLKMYKFLEKLIVDNCKVTKDIYGE